MRVLVVSLGQSFTVPNKGYGGEVVLFNLLRGFANIGIIVDLAAPTGSTCPSGQLIDTGPPTGDWTGNDIAYDVYSKHFDDYDIVHSNEHNGYPYFYGGNTPIVHTLQGISTWQALPKQKPNLITHTQWYADYIKQVYGADSRIANLAIVPEDFINSATKDDSDLFFGLLSPQKGAHIAINLASKAERPLIVAGEASFGVDQQYVQYIKTLCDKRGYPFIPSPLHEDKLRLFAEARSVILPFQAPQTSSYIALEALASGTDVFISKHSGLAELPCQDINDYPVATPRSPEECRKSVEPFRAETMARKHIEFYKEAIESGGW